MKKLSDEILNKYIDNELSQNQIDEINSKISENSSDLAKLKALKTVDSVLKQLPTFQAPGNVAQTIMGKIAKQSSVQYDFSKFFYGIIGVFITGIIASISYLFFTSESVTKSDITLQPILEKAKNLINTDFSGLYKIFSSNEFLIVSGSLAFILIAGLFFVFNFHKEYKEKINSFGH